MAILFSWADGDSAAWRRSFASSLPDLAFRVFPETGNREDIEYALVWMHPVGDLSSYPNLKAIFSIGAGCDHILRDPDLPAHVPIVRLVDATSVRDMAHYVIYWVLHYHRNFHRYASLQKTGHWQRLRCPDASERRIGVLGLGNMGANAASRLVDLGFAVSGWSRSPKALGGVTCYCGQDGLRALLTSTDILVCLLPLTADTAGLLNRERLRLLPRGASVVNLGRGGVIDDDALLEALDDDHLAGAALDVFTEEPLPVNHAFWRNPKVSITPHAAGPTRDLSAAEQIASNIQRIRRGQPPFPVWRRDLGY